MKNAKRTILPTHSRRRRGEASHIVSSFNVKRGKPYPDPYLLALEKGGFKANEAIVVENAPLGVTAGVAAGLFTIAANTGPLKDEVLSEAGASLVFPSMQALCDEWENLYRDSHLIHSI